MISVERNASIKTLGGLLGRENPQCVEVKVLLH